VEGRIITNLDPGQAEASQTGVVCAKEDSQRREANRTKVTFMLSPNIQSPLCKTNSTSLQFSLGGVAEGQCTSVYQEWLKKKTSG
jgi:hypothetical protein